MNYTDNEYEIFSRQFILKEFSQDNINKLKKFKVTLVGVGGIGCPLANYLICSGLKKIKIIDGDVIEKSNLNRQILFSNEDLGKKKVNVAKEKLNKVNPNSEIFTVDQNLDDSNLYHLLDSSIIIDTCDNWKTMKLVNDFSVKNSIPLLSASAVGFDIEIAIFENNKKNHICLNCLFPNKNDVDLPRCETVGISSIAAGIAGLITAQKTINFIMNLKNEVNTLSLFNVLNGRIENINLKNNENCYLNSL